MKKDFGVQPFLFPMPTYMIGTYNEDDTVDVMMMAWGGICDMKMVALNREADVVVLASPLYYWFISGHLKNAFDRLFAIAECDPNTRNPKKESILIMAAEGAGFEESEHWYDPLEKHIGWKSIGKVLCGYVTQPGDIKGKPELEQAYELGKSVK